MAEIPSSYLIDKASKKKNEEILDTTYEKSFNKQEIIASLASGLSIPEEGQNDLLPLEKPSLMESVENEEDITLTELEKTLTDKQRKFAWAVAKAKVSGKVNLTQCAIEAGYGEKDASNQASKLNRNALICQVIAARLPAEMKMKAVRDRGPDYVIEKAVTVLERSLQEAPVLDKAGNPTGYYMYDGALALRALDSLANWMGMTKTKVELGGSADGEAIKVDSRNVNVAVLSIADRIRAAGIKGVVEEPKPPELGAE